MQRLARVAARADRGVVQLHREAWPITAYYWLYTRYAPRVLHFSAFHSFSFPFSVFIFSLSTQNGDSALILASSDGLTDVVVELVKAGANLDLQNEVHTLSILCMCIFCMCMCMCKFSLQDNQCHFTMILRKETQLSSELQ